MGLNFTQMNKQSIIDNNNFFVTKEHKGLYFITRIIITNTWTPVRGLTICLTSDGYVINASKLIHEKNIPHENLDNLSKRILIKIPKFIQDWIRATNIVAYKRKKLSYLYS
jgi:hypothetical protein